MPEREPFSGASLSDLEVLRIQTEERLSQAQRRLFDTRDDAESWEDYRRACRYFEDVLSALRCLSLLEEEINSAA